MVPQRQPVDDKGYDVVALAASAGGIKALTHLLGGLPPDFPAPVLVAQHRSPDYSGLLCEILAGRCRLRVEPAEDGERPLPGCVHVAPSGAHLQVGHDLRLRVWRGPRIRYVRPSADLLFESLAAACGARAVAVVLTGTGADGVRGVRALRREGGYVIAQDERTAAYFDMPRAAAEIGRVDVVLPLFRMAFALTALVMGREAALARHPDPGPVGRELRMAWA